ncbi:MAG: hypothetical protein HC860_16000 [Alkalinema sp. RU_4_3]|nr:hypothetical protein [Alkalinema sp. RU_4_3]
MLDLIFYPQMGQAPAYVEVSESLYEWLARSEFSRVGESQVRSLSLDGEDLDLAVVDLGRETRQGLASFLRDQIIEESDRVLGELDEVRSKDEVQEMTYRLRKFQELRKCVENPMYDYLQRA